jgi:hypothetical protein
MLPRQLSSFRLESVRTGSYRIIAAHTLGSCTSFSRSHLKVLSLQICAHGLLSFGIRAHLSRRHFCNQGTRAQRQPSKVRHIQLSHAHGYFLQSNLAGFLSVILPAPVRFRSCALLCTERNIARQAWLRRAEYGRCLNKARPFKAVDARQKHYCCNSSIITCCQRRLRYQSSRQRDHYSTQYLHSAACINTLEDGSRRCSTPLAPPIQTLCGTQMEHRVNRNQCVHQ